MTTGMRLEATGVTKRYGGLTAVEGVDITVEPGQVTALIGPNGAGKTTLFQCLTGSERPDAGRVRFGDRDVTRLNPDARARLGLGRTFQRLAVFPSMSVADNLRVGAESRPRHRGIVRVGALLVGMLGFPIVDDAGNDRRVDEVLALLDLAELRDVPAGSLPTGTLRLVELGRALCNDPKVLLLDEPASGLDTAETRDLQSVLRDIAADGIGVLLVEHDVHLVFDVADVVYAMAEGRVLTSGRPDDVRRHPAVMAAYLDVTGTAT
jgi:branched-chain amino acid transport system ATP-binding protein